MYVPAIKLLTVVFTLLGLVISPPAGLVVVFVHLYETIVLPADAFDKEPSRVAELVGNVMVCPSPALTVGGSVDVPAAFTITVTLSVAVLPLLSFTVNWYTYVPATRAVSLACNPFDTNVSKPVDGPDTFVHL